MLSLFGEREKREKPKGKERKKERSIRVKLFGATECIGKSLDLGRQVEHEAASPYLPRQKPNTRRDEAISICITTVDYRQEVLNELPTLQLLFIPSYGTRIGQAFSQWRRTTRRAQKRPIKSWPFGLGNLRSLTWPSFGIHINNKKDTRKFTQLISCVSDEPMERENQRWLASLFFPYTIGLSS